MDKLQLYFFSRFMTFQNIFSVFGKLCLLIAVWFAYETGNNFRLVGMNSLPQTDFEETEKTVEKKGSKSFSDYSIIVSKNLLSSSASDNDQKKGEAPAVTQLKLKLVGTNLTSGSRALAIIEETSKKEQDVFELNDMVFEQAKLVEVNKESVKLDRSGKLEVLFMEEDAGSSTDVDSRSPASPPPDDKTEFTVAESELNSELANLPKLLSQARAVPYFRNGQSIGMRLFAIRSGSLYEKLGLKNGDILKSVNNTSLSDPAQALKIFEQLKNEKNISVTTERNGQDVDLRYSIQ